MCTCKYIFLYTESINSPVLVEQITTVTSNVEVPRTSVEHVAVKEEQGISNSSSR